MAAAGAADPARLGKAFTSALLVQPPRPLWGPIQAVRARRDPAYERWMPHINLLYPFVREEDMRRGGVPELVARAVASVGPFTVRMTAPGCFRHKRACTVWLDPVTEPPGALAALHAALVAVFPQCDERGGEFTPHLTVAKCSPPEQEKAEAEIVAALPDGGIEWRVESVDIVCRGAHTPYAVRHSVPLGTGDTVPAFVPRADS